MFIVAGGEAKGFGVLQDLVQDAKLGKERHHVGTDTEGGSQGLDFPGALKDLVLDAGFLQEGSHGDATDAGTDDDDAGLGGGRVDAGLGGEIGGGHFLVVSRRGHYGVE